MRGYIGNRLGIRNQDNWARRERADRTLEDHVLEENRGTLTILHPRTPEGRKALRRRASVESPYHLYWKGKGYRGYLVVPTKDVGDIRAELKVELA